MYIYRWVDYSLSVGNFTTTAKEHLIALNTVMTAVVGL